ncbi:unnamed protein product [Leptosia nina]|uniref:Uncharacterized protein n=1 Tax=Leptosia nina TaxID=320188 RepID=A0AAV1JUK7_9NEOP
MRADFKNTVSTVMIEGMLALRSLQANKHNYNSKARSINRIELRWASIVRSRVAGEASINPFCSSFAVWPHPCNHPPPEARDQFDCTFSTLQPNYTHLKT